MILERMTGGKRDLMGRCEMNGWLTRGQLRRKKYYYRLQGPFLSEHDDEKSPSDTAIWIQNSKIIRSRNSIRIELPGKKRMVLTGQSLDIVDGWFMALNAAAKRQFSDHYNLKAMLRKKTLTGMFFQGEDVHTAKPVTVKVINKKNYTQADVLMLQRELRVALTLSHPHIVSTLDVFEADERLYVILEHQEGALSLQDECDKFGPLPEEVNRKIARSLLSALSFLHSLDIIHGDVSLDNVICTAPLTSENWEVRLVDFGYGAMLDPEPRYQMVKDITLDQNSWYYIAPEQLKREVSSSIDVWAAGICMYYLFHRQYPFQGSKIAETLQKVRFRNVTFPPDADRVATMQATVFIQTLLEKNATKRCSAKAALRHSWIYGRTGGPLGDDKSDASLVASKVDGLAITRDRSLQSAADSLQFSAKKLKKTQQLGDLSRDHLISPPPIVEGPEDGGADPSWEDDTQDELIFSFHLQRALKEQKTTTEADKEGEEVDSNGGDTPRVLRWEELPRDESGKIVLHDNALRSQLYVEETQRETGEKLVLQEPMNRSDLFDRSRTSLAESMEPLVKQQVMQASREREFMRVRPFEVSARSSSRIDYEKSLTSISIARSMSTQEQPLPSRSRNGSMTGPATTVMSSVYEMDAYENRWYW